MDMDFWIMICFCIVWYCLGVIRLNKGKMRGRVVYLLKPSVMCNTVIFNFSQYGCKWPDKIPIV
jgi:hypothetical protein